MPGEAAPGLSFEEPLIFEHGAAQRFGGSIPPLDVPEVRPADRFGRAARLDAAHLPEVSEPEAFRHYVRLSEHNYAIDKGFYPLGSCTMKYNPKVNEWAARLAGFAHLHPYAPNQGVQGALELMFRLEKGLAEICGMDRVSLHPSAGAQGELAGLMMIRAYHESKGRSPRKVLIPVTAHGTNAASCAINGFDTIAFEAGDNGLIDPERVRPLLNDNIAAVMITNPSTLGLFETSLPEVARLVHECGGLVYGDGANLNALMGRTRPGDLGIDVMQFNLHKTFTTPHGGGGPGSGPVAYKNMLAPYAPTPTVEQHGDGSFVLDYNRPHSIGQLRAFYGNFGMMVRAYTYLREMGAAGLKSATDLAVLNANYLRVHLSKTWHTPFNRLCMHEVIISDRHLKETGVTTLDIAKRLMDYGYHAPTVYFPLLVKGAMLIEPTETETKETLDHFMETMQQISVEAQREPELVKTAPHLTRLKRLDETKAAREPKLKWTPRACPQNHSRRSRID